MQAVSENYRLLEAHEVDAVAVQCENAWRDPSMPERQWNTVVARELDAFRNRKPVLPYDVLLDCLRLLPIVNTSETKLLDVGASSGYYSEVLKMGGCRYDYTGCDYSLAYEAFAHIVFPGIQFHRADARNLPFADGSYDIVLHSATIMHIREYEKAIAEAARVASHYVVFHRTPFLEGKPTEFYIKAAYGIDCLEIKINEDELLDLFKVNGLRLMHSRELFFNKETKAGHKTYVMAKT